MYQVVLGVLNDLFHTHNRDLYYYSIYNRFSFYMWNTFVFHFDTWLYFLCSVYTLHAFHLQFVFHFASERLNVWIITNHYTIFSLDVAFLALNLYPDSVKHQFDNTKFKRSLEAKHRETCNHVISHTERTSRLSSFFFSWSSSSISSIFPMLGKKHWTRERTERIVRQRREDERKKNPRVGIRLLSFPRISWYACALIYEEVKEERNLCVHSNARIV